MDLARLWLGACLLALTLSTAAFAGTAPPTVTGTAPTDAASDIPVDTTVDITFSRWMNHGSVETEFSMTDGTTAVAGTFAWASNTDVTFTPDADLAPLTTYTVTITGDAEHMFSGQTLDGDSDGVDEGSPTDDYTFSFTTEPLTPDEVVIHTPALDFAAGQHTVLVVHVVSPHGNLCILDNTTQITFTPDQSGAVSDVVTGTGDGGYGVPAGAEAVTVAGGVAAVQLTDAVAETFNVAITNDQTLTNPSDDVITVTSAPAEVVVTDPGADFQTGQTTNVTIEVRDGTGTLVSTDDETIVTFTPTSSGYVTAVVTGTSTDTLDVPAAPVAVTVASGVATVTLSDDAVDTFTVAITNGSSLTNPSDLSFNVTPVPATQVVITVPGADFPLGGTTTLEVQVQGAGGELVTTDDTTVITFTPTLSGTISGVVTGTGDGTYDGGAEDVTVSGGIASVSLTDDVMETFDVQIANDGGLTDPADDSITVTPVPYEIVITVPGGSITAGGSATLTVEVRDSGGGLVAGDSTTNITFAPTLSGTVTGVATGTGDGTYDVVGGAEIVTVAGGVASITLGDLVAETFEVSITNDAGLLNPANDSVVVTADVAAEIVVASGGGGFAPGEADTLSLEIRDQYGNLVDDSTTTITLTPTLGGTVAEVLVGNGDAAYGSAGTAEDILADAGVVSVTITDLVEETFTITITNDAALTDPAVLTIVVALSDSPFGGGCAPGGGAPLVVVALLAAAFALLSRRPAAAAIFLALVLTVGCADPAALNRGVYGVGARVGYLETSGEDGSTYGGSPTVGFSVANMIPHVDTGVDYMSLQSDTSDASAAILRFRADLMFARWDVTGAASFYGLGGYSFLYADVSDGAVDSEYTNAVDVGFGVASALSKFDARLTYSVLLDSENISAFVTFEGGYYF